MSQAVLLRGVQELLDHVPYNARHPGLALDKFPPPGPQVEQKKVLDRVCEAKGDLVLLRERGALRDSALSDAGALIWEATSAGPLTLHLSRANVLENAGIALHPLYGFAYLPGSGLKGAARAYAKTIWLQAQPETERVAASSKIVDVFGCAPRSDDGKEAAGRAPCAEDSRAGAVVFHDAWPEAWPKLFVDIAAIHHPKYYQAGESSVPSPGDWETPSLISFLAITPRTKFRFAVSPRSTRPRPDAALLGLAQNWLNGALATLGIGAKTAAGYGLFQVPDFAPAALPASRAEAQFKLTLVTPAFLAGSAQGKDDCDLRGPTLRGQLRWWWRTMHAAHLEPRVLRRLEAVVWGASSEGSAVRISLRPLAISKPEKFDFRAEPKFLRENEIPRPPQRGLTGISYLSYGMADKPGEWRYYRQPGDQWELRLSARESEFRLDPRAKPGTGVKIDAGVVLAQAVAALRLLSEHGGVGAKARKGFGCFDLEPMEGGPGRPSIMDQAAKLRRDCRVPTKVNPRPEVSTLENLRSSEVVLGWTNAWYAIDALGRSYQSASKDIGPELKQDKELLGTPRTGIRPKYPRLASAVHLHLLRSPNGLVARITTFDLPGIRPSAAVFLAKIRGGVQSSLAAMAARHGGRSALYPPPKDRDVPPTGPKVPTAPLPPKGPKQKSSATQRDAGSPFVGQRGFGIAGEEVEVIALDGQMLRVRFVYDDEEDTISIRDFRPKVRR